MRTITPEAEEILDKKFPVLDHGYVVLTDYMGGDDDIANAARVSNSGQVTKKSTNRGLIRYLLRHRHTSPFEMVEFKFICRMPIFVARQWIRHRTASVNEVSGRYSVLPDEFYIPRESELSFQSKGNNQGRAEEKLSPETAALILRLLKDDAESTFRRYHTFLGEDTGIFLAGNASKELKDGGGLARELARINLPLSTYTEWVWKIDLHNLLHFLGLRLEEHAQWEIRQFAGVLYDMAKAVAPLAVEAFRDYQFQAATFSRQERELLAKLLGHGLINEIIDRAAQVSVTSGLHNVMSQREFDEFRIKLLALQDYTRD
jgi:thymidylate synthase (FAD)